VIFFSVQIFYHSLFFVLLCNVSIYQAQKAEQNSPAPATKIWQVAAAAVLLAACLLRGFKKKLSHESF